jgi:hypothetical protein
MNFLLHTHAESDGLLLELCKEVFLHGILDTLKIIPFLFLTYLLMEFIEHKGAEKIQGTMRRAGVFGPFVSGLFGVIPQCGFSTVSANLYTARIITLGSLIAVFLSTSDEMIPIMVSANVPITTLLFILLYKVAVGILVGFAIDITLRLMKKGKADINIDEICENDNCGCEGGIFRSALHHTLSIGLFVLIITFIINLLIFFIGDESLAQILDRPILSHIIASAVGLIPNCAVSVALTDFALHGIISAGTMLSGLFSGAGVGLIVLLRVNKNKKENLIIIGMLLLFGTLFGVVGDLIGFNALI